MKVMHRLSLAYQTWLWNSHLSASHWPITALTLYVSRTSILSKTLSVAARCRISVHRRMTTLCHMFMAQILRTYAYCVHVISVSRLGYIHSLVWRLCREFAIVNAESFAWYSPGACPRLVDARLAMNSQLGEGQISYSVQQAEFILHF